MEILESLYVFEWIKRIDSIIVYFKLLHTNIIIWNISFYIISSGLYVMFLNGIYKWGKYYEQEIKIYSNDAKY